MGQTTITIDESTLERFKSLKTELDETQQAPNHTNDSFLKCLMDTYEAANEGHYGEQNDPLTWSEADEIAEQLADQIAEQLPEQNRDDFRKVLELVERIPEKTADEFARKYA